MTDDFDEIDRSILAILLREARTPIAQIAESVGLSRPSVTERIEKLQRRGAICGTTVVLYPPAFGLGVTAFVSARQVGSFDTRGRRVWEEFLRREEIVEAHSVAGDDCYLLKVRTDSISSLNAIVNELGADPLGLATRTTIVLETHCEKIGGITLPRGGDHAS
ncbi:MAG TPA: Lrp/AsnC family transcriptional regulator [Thermoanaerobaculia bacterium]|nr:Lrp/AsnC family transcriptional regulator [Thermoanaerobaculia bacterium]